MTLLLAACSSDSSSSGGGSSGGSQGRKYKIAFVVGNVNDAFYQKAHQGAEEEAKKLGVELVYQGPQQFSAQAQIPVVDALFAQRPDALAIAVTDPTALVAPLQKWADAKIPIVTYDSALADPPYEVVSKIGSANLEGGRLAADEMAKLIGDKGKVAIIDLNTSDKVLTDRKDGFVQQLKDKHPGVQVVDTQLTDVDFPRAQTIAQTYVNKYPDLAGIFTTYSFATEFAAKGLQDLNAHERVKLVGYEAGPKEIDYIKQGVLKAVVAQQPAEEGRLAVRSAYNFLAGNKDQVKAETELPGVTIDAGNVDRMQQYYYQTAG